MRSTRISLWMLLSISHGEQMDITGHRTLAGISIQLQLFNKEKKNVSLLKNLQVKIFPQKNEIP